MLRQPKTETPSPDARIANFTAIAQAELLTPDARRLFERNALDSTKAL